MVKERYTGFQLHRVNDSDGLNADDIDYAFATNGSIVKFIHDFKLAVQATPLAFSRSSIAILHLCFSTHLHFACLDESLLLLQL